MRCNASPHFCDVAANIVTRSILISFLFFFFFRGGSTREGAVDLWIFPENRETFWKFRVILFYITRRSNARWKSLVRTAGHLRFCLTECCFRLGRENENTLNVTTIMQKCHTAARDRFISFCFGLLSTIVLHFRPLYFCRGISERSRDHLKRLPNVSKAKLILPNSYVQCTNFGLL